MPFYSMDEPEYWAQMPAKLKHLQGVDGMNRVVYFVLSKDPENDPDAPVAAVLEMEPGTVITRHAHDCERFEMIVKGTLEVDDRVLGPGDVMISHAHEEYGPHTAGADGCTTLEVFGTYTGSYMPIYPGPNGPVTIDWSEPTAAAEKAALLRRG